MFYHFFMVLARKIKKFIPVILGVLSILALSLIISYPGRLVFFTIIILWVAILVISERKLSKVKKITQSVLPVLIVTIFSFVSLLSLIEWPFLNYIIVFINGLAVFVLFQSVITVDESLLQIQQKPYRRIITLLWAFDVYTLVSSLFAVGLFFSNIPFWLIALTAGIIFGFVSFMIWKMYFHLSFKKVIVWIFLVFFLMIEIIWIMSLLPFGYLVSGFFVTWVWYILQLLLRFHFGPKGVVWKNQINFLVVNLFLYLALLIFFVRWV